MEYRTLYSFITGSRTREEAAREMAFSGVDTGRSSELLQKRLLPDEVFELLHNRIVTGQYRPGQWLRQQELARELGVSPTPIREALDRLVSAGLAQRFPYRGVQILQPTTEEIAEAYVLRGLLEVAATSWSTRSSLRGQLCESKGGDARRVTIHSSARLQLEFD
jgi:hypothetical protein